MSTLPNTCSRGVEWLEPRTLLAGGSADPAFGGGAPVTIGFAAGTSVLNDLLMMADGGVLAGGYCVPQFEGLAGAPQMALAKYTFSGALDPTFGIGGQVVATPR